MPMTEESYLRTIAHLADQLRRTQELLAVATDQLQALRKPAASAAQAGTRDREAPESAGNSG